MFVHGGGIHPDEGQVLCTLGCFDDLEASLYIRKDFCLDLDVT